MLRLVYVGVFALAAVGCFAAMVRARRIDHRETRYGLYGLLATSGLWATALAGSLLSDSVVVVANIYELGLVTGLATVGAWLYFCSAYTGNDYHRRPRIRWPAVGLFVAVTLVKLTNTTHGLYFSAIPVTRPFEYVRVDLLAPHWVVTLAAYTLSAVGFYMLFRLFVRSNVETTLLASFVSLAGFPVILTAFGYVTGPWLLPLNYEPIGVAAFAIGTLYLTESTFEQVRWTGHRQAFDDIQEPILILDDESVVREMNEAASRLFPELAPGRTLADALPAVEAYRAATDDSTTEDFEDVDVLELEAAGGSRYYLIQETPITFGPHRVGQTLVFNDVTVMEEQRRELERQSEQLEGFGAAVAHELRNTLGIVSGNLRLVTDSLETESDEAVTMAETALEATNRMYEVVGQLTTMAQLSRRVADPSWQSFEEMVRRGYSAAEADGVTLDVDGGGRILADPPRMVELVKNATQLAAETDSTTLTAALTDDGFVLETDGDPVPPGDTEALFEYGAAVPHAEAGMLGPNIQTLARAHDWMATLEEGTSPGIRLRIRGASVEHPD